IYDTYSGNFQGGLDWSVTFTGAEDAIISARNVSAVPVPAAAWLFGSAMLGLAGLRRKSV
ncbi:MAG: VPLPA-CTERM sorting domain-containing protein, partial [Pseudomonadota bacterium]